MFKEEQIHFPQSEIKTMLVPVSTGCPYNKCTFCAMYTGDAYSEIPLQDMEYELLNGDPYTDRVFLTGADPLAVGFERMSKILKLIHKYFPYCGCVAAYASVRTVHKYSTEELAELHKAGLGLLYIGFETGSEEVLKFVQKGHTVAQAVETGKKLNEAKLPFNSIIMYGLAGEGKCVENARQTAAMLNQFDSSKIVTMNLTIFETTELSEMTKNGTFIPAGSEEKLEELKTLLQNLEARKTTEFDTTHATNIIKMTGSLPGEKERLLEHIEDLKK
ncbi:radical SAM protein [Roseburia hominis]